MAQNKVALSVCRIRKLLSGDQGKATIGGGCIVSLNLGGKASNASEVKEQKSSVLLITTTQVITKNDLLSASTSIVVEFLDGGNGKISTFNLGFKYSTDFPDPLPGRVLAGTRDALKEVSFIIIPVEKFDNRNFFKRAYSSVRGTSFEKRSLPCSHQSGENLQIAISRRQLLCHVLFDDSKNDAFNTEPYCLEFGADTSEFFLTSPLDHDGVDDKKRLKDFHRDERPWGAPVLNAEGRFVGLLAITPSNERKLFPLFLPTLDKDSSTLQTLSKEDWNSQESDCVVMSSDITVNTETSMAAPGLSGQAAATGGADESSSQERRNKDTTINNQHSTGQDENAGNNNCSTSRVQGSGNPVANNPWQLGKSSHEPASNEFFPMEEPQPQIQHLSHLVEQDVRGQDLGSDSSLEQDSDCELSGEQVDSLSGLSENVHQSQGPAIRPSLLTQNSCYDQPVDSAEFEDEEGYPYGVGETASPKPFTEMTITLRHSQDPESDSDGDGIDQPRSHRADSAGLFSSSTPSQTTRSITCHNNSPGELEHVTPDSLVKDKIISKVKVMDTLSLYLDRSVCPGSRDVPLTQRWEHLADEFKIPEDRKRQCENFTGMLSPSENLFEHLCMTDDVLPIKTIKDHLRTLGRNDVVAELDKNSNLCDLATVTDLCEKYPETLNVVCLKLDDKRGPKNWHDLGICLGITAGVLWKFKDPSGCSPTEAILKKLETLHPDLRIMTMEAALEQLNLPTVAKLLNGLPDGSTIQTLLDDLDVLEKVTAMLDRQESSWFRFGRKFEITRKELEYLKPDPIPSPTKVVMECIVQNNPDLTMKSFLETLAKIKRYDVIKALKGFFHSQDIDDILPWLTQSLM